MLEQALGLHYYEKIIFVRIFNMSRGSFCLVIAILLCPTIYAKSVLVDGVKYGVMIESSRIIYPLQSSGTTLSVVNPQTYPVLVQTRIVNEEKSNIAPFFVTPPLFRLDAGQKYSLQVTKTGGNFPEDKESLLWACVKGIPPKVDDLWADDKNKNTTERKDIGVRLNISIDNCIKFIVRPPKLKGSSTDYAGEISWRISGGGLIAQNKSPFYMNIGEIYFNDIRLPAAYIAPWGEQKFLLQKNHASMGSVTWNVIDDYGTLSQTFSSKITGKHI